MTQTTTLGTEKITTLLLKFSIPAIVGMVVNALYNIVDRVFIGQGVGPQGLAGVTVAFPVMTIIMALGMLIGIGGSALTSIRLGQHNKEAAEKILGNSFSLFLIISALTTILGLLFVEPILVAFGAQGGVLPYAVEYTKIIFIGVIFQYISFGMNAFIRSEGNPNIAMITMLIGCILNIILNPVFIYGFDMGIAGAAVATVSSQAVSSIWIMYHFLSKRSNLHLRKTNLPLDWSLVKQILAIGSAPAAVQIGASVVGVVTTYQLTGFGGDYAVSAMGAIMSVSMLFLMPIFGINQGAQPIIGYNYGAKQYSRVKQALGYAMAAATIFSTIGFIAIVTFPQIFIKMFNSDPKLLEVGVPGIRIYLFMLPLIGFQIVASNYFQAVGKPKKAIVLSLLRQVFLLIPLLYILPTLFSLSGVWLAGPVSDFLSAAITFVAIYYEWKYILTPQNTDKKTKNAA